ncbi:hypothetical protein M431DRAFT_213732 [Trichoderma harzianum CBS 226.95]|jgi:hypothetical protein|uniref:Uncharacterized protein n=1 Tax=Trichoderma harzianum CBS 226.95 TaxID=983964 RepID=A0A2T4A5C7_TRIHA|nr:hypothetical protein M431DRAFT_213732 [Trichoderma harzianum CBS 226.95]PTB52246.1 hypothetical protein M431DRAFT_213732 [Trichoderma harzianum CBS 226.95]
MCGFPLVLRACLVVFFSSVFGWGIFPVLFSIHDFDMIAAMLSKTPIRNKMQNNYLRRQQGLRTKRK